MANLDAAALGDKAIRLGLITTEQLQEGWDEVGALGGDPEPLLLALERKRYLTPWQSSKLLKDDPDGYFLGGYRILYKIASGSFGRVYRADDPRTGTVVAMKILRRKWSDDKHSIELFEREGRMGMSLRHPNIVEILAVNRDIVTKQYYIVMEFVEGSNLRDFLGIRKQLDPPDALRILEDASAGLAYAYSRGVSHRDMKLTNVLISTQGPTKLVDFGLAGVFGKLLERDKTHVDRTVDYAGLEKCTGAVTGDIRSDIYFLGCVAYEMLTGKAPLDMTRDPRIRMSRERFMNVPPLRPEEVQGAASVVKLVNTMIALQPSQRYQTPSQLLEAVREVRREVEGKAAGKGGGARSVFVVETDERLQNIFREKLRDEGFRVLLAADPVRAVERFRQQTFDALVVDASQVGDGSIALFEKVVDDAGRQGIPLAGLLILSEEQAGWRDTIKSRPNVALFVHPVTFKQLRGKLLELLPKPA